MNLTEFSIDNDSKYVPNVNKDMRPYEVLGLSDSIYELNDICSEIADKKNMTAIERDHCINDKLIPTILCDSMAEILDIDREYAETLYNCGLYRSIKHFGEEEKQSLKNLTLLSI